MIILSIDTSCDETSVAITEGRKVIANVIYSQILLHKKWGGVVPSIAKRAHEEKIDFVINETLKKIFWWPVSGSFPPMLASKKAVAARRRTPSSLDTQKIFDRINYLAVTQGPGLAVALEVGIKKAKELAEKYNKKLIAINHMEGHIYSCFGQNRQGNPKKEFRFPYLALLVSGGHTELVIFRNHLQYKIIGETIDDAAGEALDKAAKMLGLGYPGGPVIERLATQVNNKDFYHFPRPMLKSKDLNFSFSGLKTSFYYFLNRTDSVFKKNQPRTESVKKLSSSFQEAVFDTLIKKTERAIKLTKINNLVVGGGVIANHRLRKLLRDLAKRHHGRVLFPPFKYLTGDNAAMIGVAAFYKAKKGQFVKNINKLDRIPRLKLTS
ncbi:tRNA (adenosine(37)-N6)-threonylcarbamoyltransferase complex transferase subunit TsaD [Candidatus Roizmanbacteria bacterium CG02_land_8_20_14_3_00_36_15]|uniref:tRNA N6-adenosine threonylcarbamoyltransferase n=2 Tax=Candidatus Roizmaniibacteriota TaxID=1752723 RepID=A0A2M8KJU0_9BACT|nr:MAG: tRNA (adenosine(37)-N6)-threonylcarbamoyltransferase complex transferase subunit TsaD [Candidatus Roizmanbacteria bacterium CG03_land_8_20_14_0_80_36_21]PIV38168.1 MAG: tRNA (adenosine(37)-N6)-threonylcarbamoyltransferase complex transferase subunit TsaD [Candidatus Roizmanbacteria bacterium CG02_land_8_20_14_3_00_36_15]PIY69597.1 MAG: tRNA (adenosine(37)-N6)-threonylcarbamoyltransferase complex transferase subunit TsaD [Candidatus Roizmanbacteria bacterium CG_4_10_14_0_8_um_filter_36_36]